MRVIVTRPAHSAAKTAEQLRLRGHEPVLLPLTRAIHHPAIARDALRQTHSALAITSAEAIKVLASMKSELGDYLDEPLYAVGTATAEAALELGFRDVRTGLGTGERLADIIVRDEPHTLPPLLYLAGKPRSSRFEEALRVKDIVFTTAEIYSMTKVAYEPADVRETLLEPPADCVLLYSRENTRLFFQLAGPYLQDLPNLAVIFLSENVAESIPSNFSGKIKIADYPSEERLLSLI